MAERVQSGPSSHDYHFAWFEIVQFQSFSTRLAEMQCLKIIGDELRSELSSGIQFDE